MQTNNGLAQNVLTLFGFAKFTDIVFLLAYRQNKFPTRISTTSRTNKKIGITQSKL